MPGAATGAAVTEAGRAAKRVAGAVGTMRRERETRRAPRAQKGKSPRSPPVPPGGFHLKTHSGIVLVLTLLALTAPAVASPFGQPAPHTNRSFATEGIATQGIPIHSLAAGASAPVFVDGFLDWMCDIIVTNAHGEPGQEGEPQYRGYLWMPGKDGEGRQFFIVANETPMVGDGENAPDEITLNITNDPRLEPRAVALVARWRYVNDDTSPLVMEGRIEGVGDVTLVGLLRVLPPTS